jgi:hypothetical protein
LPSINIQLKGFQVYGRILLAVADLAVVSLHQHTLHHDLASIGENFNILFPSIIAEAQVVPLHGIPDNPIANMVKVVFYYHSKRLT